MLKLPRLRRACVLLGLAFASTLSITGFAYAQSNSHVAVGVDLTARPFFDSGFSTKVKPSLLYRIRKHRSPENGWRFRIPEFGFNWFTADVEMPVAGQDVGIGHLTVRPFLGGVAEAFVARDGKDELSFNLLAGPAFVKFRVSGAARDAYRQRLGADPVAIDAKNTIVVRPGISYWHDLAKRLGLHVAINYIIARPEVVIRTPLGETKSRWKADNVAVKVGLSVGLF